METSQQKIQGPWRRVGRRRMRRNGPLLIEKSKDQEQLTSRLTSYLAFGRNFSANLQLRPCVKVKVKCTILVCVVIYLSRNQVLFI